MSTHGYRDILHMALRNSEDLHVGLIALEERAPEQILVNPFASKCAYLFQPLVAKNQDLSNDYLLAREIL